MSRFVAFIAALAIPMSAITLTGCGGSSEPTPSATAQAATPPQPKPSAPKKEDSEPESIGYGSEDYGAEESSQNSGGGGGSFADSYAAMQGGGGYGSEDDTDGMYEGMYAGDPTGGAGSSDPYGSGDPYGGMYGSSGMQGSYGSEDGGDMYGGMYGGGMTPGGRGGNQGGFGMVSTFVRSSCGSCHLNGQRKGEVSLDGISPDFENPENAELLVSIARVLEDGSMPPQGQRQVNAQQKQQVITFLNQALEESGALDRSYLELARKAFSTGEEKKALQLMQAHAIVGSDEEAQSVFDNVRWFAAGPRPATTLRVAVGVVLDAPNTLTDLKPIGSSQQGGGGGGYEGGGIGMPGGPAGGGTRAAARTFNALTGEFGEALVGAFESRWAEGQMGTVFNDVVFKAPQPRGNNRGGMGGYNPGMGVGMGSEMGGMGTNGLGRGGYGSEGGDMYGGAYGGQGYGGSGYGGGQQASASGGEGYGTESSGFALAELRPNIRPGETVTPGMVFIGVGSQAELMERAAKQDVDAIFVFDVEASMNNRTRRVNNKTQVRALTLGGDSLGATRSLVNTEVERARMRGAEDDLKKNIERLFILFDKSMKLDAMPPLKAQHAEGRIRQLLKQREDLPEEEEPTMDLAVMFEARMFQSMGLISEEQLSMVYQIVLEGNEGIALADGSVDDRKMVIDELLSSQG